MLSFFFEYLINQKTEVSKVDFFSVSNPPTHQTTAIGLLNICPPYRPHGTKIKFFRIRIQKKTFEFEKTSTKYVSFSISRSIYLSISSIFSGFFSGNFFLVSCVWFDWTKKKPKRKFMEINIIIIKR